MIKAKAGMVKGIDYGPKTVTKLRILYYIFHHCLNHLLPVSRPYFATSWAQLCIACVLQYAA